MKSGETDFKETCQHWKKKPSSSAWERRAEKYSSVDSFQSALQTENMGMCWIKGKGIKWKSEEIKGRWDRTSVQLSTLTRGRFRLVLHVYTIRCEADFVKCLSEVFGSQTSAKVFLWEERGCLTCMQTNGTILRQACSPECQRSNRSLVGNVIIIIIIMTSPLWIFEIIVGNVFFAVMPLFPFANGACH